MSHRDDQEEGEYHEQRLGDRDRDDIDGSGADSKKRKRDRERFTDLDVDDTSPPIPIISLENLKLYLQIIDQDPLQNLIAEQALKNGVLYQSLVDLLQKNTMCRRIYIKGLPFDVKQDQLREYFAEYGPMDDCAVAFDKVLQRNKGYGFIVFKDLKSTESALRDPVKMIDGRRVTVSLAAIRDTAVPPPSSSAGPASSRTASSAALEEDIETRKLFVRNLSSQTTSESLKHAFNQFGEVEDSTVVYDKSTQRSRNYGFVVFKFAAGAAKALRNTEREIDGRVANLSLAAQGKAQSVNLPQSSAGAAGTSHGTVGTVPGGHGPGPGPGEVVASHGNMNMQMLSMPVPAGYPYHPYGMLSPNMMVSPGTHMPMMMGGVPGASMNPMMMMAPPQMMGSMPMLQLQHPIQHHHKQHQQLQQQYNGNPPDHSRET